MLPYLATPPCPAPSVRMSHRLQVSAPRDTPAHDDRQRALARTRRRRKVDQRQRGECREHRHHDHAALVTTPALLATPPARAACDNTGNGTLVGQHGDRPGKILACNDMDTGSSHALGGTEPRENVSHARWGSGPRQFGTVPGRVLAEPARGRAPTRCLLGVACAEDDRDHRYRHLDLGLADPLWPVQSRVPAAGASAARGRPVA